MNRSAWMHPSRAMILIGIVLGAAGALNYYFVRAWGRRAHKHFRARHLAVLAQRARRTETRSLSVVPLLPAKSPVM